MQVVTANEELDKQLKSGGVQSDGKQTGIGNDEVLRLQAQNTALQKNLTGNCAYSADIISKRALTQTCIMAHLKQN